MRAARTSESSIGGAPPGFGGVRARIDSVPRDRACRIALPIRVVNSHAPEGATMRRILALSVLACLAASPEFRFGP